MREPTQLDSTAIERGRRTRALRWRVAVGSWLVLLVVYAAPGEFIPGNDCKATAFQPVITLEGDNTFTPRNAPFMFDWRAHTDEAHVGRSFRALPSTPAQSPRVNGYFLSPTRFEGQYLNNYGPLPGWLVLPFAAAARALVGSLREHPKWIWRSAQLAAANSVALAAALLGCAVLAASGGPRGAAFAALYFGLGTVAWPSASLSPFQQSFALPFLTAGMWAAHSAATSPLAALAAGASLGLATVVRTPLAVYGLSYGMWLLLQVMPAFLRERRLRSLAPALSYALAATTPLIGLAVYNEHYFGSVFGHGQLQRTAAALGGDPWATPLSVGLAGVLFSPGRGLFVYSPAALFALPGAYRALRDFRHHPLSPFVAGAIALIPLYAKWGTWWGGWCYGPRLLLDALPVLCALLGLDLSRWLRSKATRALFGVAVAWSVFTAAVGASAYDLVGWDARKAYAVIDESSRAATLYLEREPAERSAERPGYRIQPMRLDINLAEHRRRLWKWKDSPFWYYATHLSDARAQRHEIMRQAVTDPGT